MIGIMNSVIRQATLSERSTTTIQPATCEDSSRETLARREAAIAEWRKTAHR
ncbi:hypothetical protein [Pararhodobacter marinus]|uniref:hypothetical protein n=1 Tax=Pararhodobacter marinus TaxID=2184063 RepID=UPI00143D5FFB|nr:hypothetical protein [Pararhodobacter marinus]